LEWIIESGSSGSGEKWAEQDVVDVPGDKLLWDFTVTETGNYYFWIRGYYQAIPGCNQVKFYWDNTLLSTESFKTIDTINNESIDESLGGWWWYRLNDNYPNGLYLTEGTIGTFRLQTSTQGLAKVDNILITTESSVNPRFINGGNFLKDTGWTLHHRSGNNYLEGDVFKYYNETLVSIISDMVLNVTIAYAGCDINQHYFHRGFPIRHAWDGDWGAAQSYTPLHDTITSVDLYLRTFGTPEFNLTVELREGSIDGTLIDTIILTPAEVGSSWNWINIDFDDTSVSSDTRYFIKCPPPPSGVTTSFGYEWGYIGYYTHSNPYPDGCFWFTRDSGNLWRDLPTRYDYTFRAWGINS
jgi:hypothetical protein